MKEKEEIRFYPPLPPYINTNLKGIDKHHNMVLRTLSTFLTFLTIFGYVLALPSLQGGAKNIFCGKDNAHGIS